jgi:hypothetical protein
MISLKSLRTAEDFASLVKTMCSSDVNVFLSTVKLENCETDLYSLFRRSIVGLGRFWSSKKPSVTETAGVTADLHNHGCGGCLGALSLP